MTNLALITAQILFDILETDFFFAISPQEHCTPLPLVQSHNSIISFGFSIYEAVSFSNFATNFLLELSLETVLSNLTQ